MTKQEAVDFLHLVAESYKRLSLDKENMRRWYNASLEGLTYQEAVEVYDEMSKTMPDHFMPSPAEFNGALTRLKRGNHPAPYEPLPEPKFSVGKAAIAEMRRQYFPEKEGA